MSVAELVGVLAARGVELWFEGDRLRFRAPKGALTAEQRADLSARKADVLAHLRAEAAGTTTTGPLSFSQRSLWFVNQEAPNSAAYNVGFAARIVSSIDIAALRQAVQALSDRHPSLRTTFPIVDGAPVQSIAGISTAVLELHESAGDDHLRLHDRVMSDYRRPFDLEHGPVFRSALYTVGPQQHVLLLTVHHIAADGWSLLQLLEELRALYAEATGGPAVSNARPPVDYLQFTRWQAEMLAGDEGARLANYWRTQMASPRAEVELPADRPRPPRRSTRGGTFPMDLAAATSARLRQMAKDQSTTLFVVLLAAFKTLLYRYTGTEDIVVGTPTFGRNRPEFARVIGDFVNVIPLRSQVSSDVTFSGFVGQLKKTVFEALGAQDYPFSLLVEQLQPVRDPSRSPLLEILFVLQRFDQLRELEPVLVPGASEATVDYGGLKLGHFPLDQQEGQFDLTLQVVDRSGPLAIQFKYNLDLFDEETIVALSRHFGALLDGVVGEPEQTIGHLPLLAADERAALLGLAATSVRSEPEPWTLHERFETQVRRSPDAIAATCNGQHLSYAELNRRANRLAHRLRQMGVGRDTLVGLCAERSLDLVVAVLGILKAGGAYLPIDLAYPADRVAFMLEDAAAPVLVAQRSVLERLPAQGAAIVFVDDDLDEYPDTNPAPLAQPDDLAYVIYTSGSTGRPKGTMLTHRSVDRLFTSTDHWYGFGAQDVWTLFHSIAFDFSVWEVWGALLYGGRLVVVPFMVSRSPEMFLALLHDEGVTVLNQTPSAFRQLIQADLASGAPRPTKLRYVIFGGETLELQSLRPWFERYGDAAPAVVNMYGITETCVHVTYRPITYTDLDSGAGSVIGVPIPDLSIYVLDGRQELVPIGVPGEMYVGGAGLARGYLNRPDLTATRFIGNPFVPGERLYRTGDLARRRGARELEYLGRIDQQVKIRGFRIELGEIESVIAQVPGVRENVVVVRQHTQENRRLVAYIVGDGDEELLLESVRTQLRAALPDYMVPTQLLLLDGMPLTSNGKIDRGGLLAAQSRGGRQSERSAPKTPVEDTLARLWCEVLGVDNVSRDDNFFALGGHSLLVVTLIERMRRAGFAADVPTIFSNSVLSAMAAAVTVAGDEGAAETVSRGIPVDCTRIDPKMVPLAGLTDAEIDVVSAAVPGGVANIQDIYPLLHQQEGILFHHQLAGDDGVDAYQVRWIMAIDGRDRLDQILAALQLIIDRHDALRTLVLWERLTHPVQVVCRRARMVVTEIDDLHGRPASECVADLTDRRRMRLALTKAPLLTAVVAREDGRDEWHLAIVVHHIVIDHVSLGILASELRSLLSGGFDVLPPPRPFRDIVARILLRGARDSEAFFGDMLGDVDQPTLPFDLADVQGDGGTVEEAVHRVDHNLASRVRSAALRHRVSPAVLFHVAWAMVVARCSGRSDVVFGTVLYGRSEGLSGFENTMGMLINTLPIRVSLQDASPAEVLQKTYQRLSQLMRHEHVSLALAQRCSKVAAPTPLFSALLNYRHVAVPWEGAEAGAQTLEGVRTTLGEERTNYPLMMAVDDLANGFVLTAQCARSVDPQRAVELLATVLENLTAVLLSNYAPHSGETEPSCEDLILKLSLVTSAERHRVVHEFNATAQQIDATPAMVQFERQVARTPDARAVAFEGDDVSYALLNRRANWLAHRLRNVGVRQGVLVGVCLERCPDLVVALLGIHKAGGAYVPLDPGFPSERLSFMLADSEAAVLVTAGDTAKGIELPDLVRVLDISADVDPVTSQDDANPESGVQGSDIAYVIYTSGSTGRPKGVAISHLALANLLWSMRHEPGLTSDDTLAAVTTISFDIAGLEIFLPLIVGARIDLIPRNTAVDGTALAQRLAASGATVMQATPATWRLLLEAGWKPSGRFRALCGGEPLPPDVARALRDRVDELWNLYGPTETTIWSTVERVREGPITVGRPIANTQIFVVDKSGDVVPVGVTGEIWIGGHGVASGYHRRPELSQERFVPDHLTGRPGGRVYRTGDLGRWGTDGRLHHLGRLDHQVKIRGFRIELGEVEAVLCQHPQVRDAVVLAVQAAGDEQRLVGYVVASSPAVAVSELREHLGQTLPDYMVPAAFVLIDKLPLTNNGKVDRNALPSPGDVDVIAAEGFTAPVTETEKAVAQVFAEALNIPAVGVHHSFFELGGHSLLATRALVRLRERFKLDVPLMALFQAPTVHGLSRWLDTEVARESSTQRSTAAIDQAPRWKGLVAAQANGSRPPLFLLTGYMDADDTPRILANLMPYLGSDQPLCGLRPRWLDGHSPQYSSVAEMTDEYVAEIRGFQPRGPYYILGDCVGGVVAVEIAQKLTAQGDEVALLLLLDTERPQYFSPLLNGIARLAERGKHIAELLREFRHPREGTRRQMIADLVQRKLRRAGLGASPMTATDHVYQHRTSYRRVLKGHRLKRYAGRIELIVTEDVYRFIGLLGWEGFADGGLEIHRTPGDHETVRSQNCRELGLRIRMSIDRAISQRPHQPSDGLRARDGTPESAGGVTVTAR